MQLSPKTLLCLSILVLFTSLPRPFSAEQLNAATETPENFESALEQGLFLVRETNRGADCHHASGAEVDRFLQATDLNLRETTRDGLALKTKDLDDQTESGLQIILRGTQQLESHPQALAAFQRAAEKWEELLQSNITIIIDVDFGTTHFGAIYPAGTIGSTYTQLIIANQGLNEIRFRAMNGASNQNEFDLYSSLPTGAVPTTLGPTSNLSSTSAGFRAAGLIRRIADPALEERIGRPPSIGFNSSFNFDFDSSDGIESSKLDFEGLVLHEMAHVLGFVSRVGAEEIFPTGRVELSMWDLFRFLPGTIRTEFSSATRLLSSGVNQVFFDGNSETPVATGRPDGSGGDGSPASHWKSKTILGAKLGLMDPNLSPGEVALITENDLRVLDLIGFRVRDRIGPVSHPPLFEDLQSNLDGDILKVTLRAADVDGDLTAARISPLNREGRSVGQPITIPVSQSGQVIVDLSLNVPGFNQLPTATSVQLVLTDAGGNLSPTAISSFDQADPGGAILLKAVYNEAARSITVRGSGFVEPVEVEINGELIATPARVKLKSDTKIKVSGSQSALNLSSGPNRVRLRSNGLRSNIIILVF